MGSVKVTVFGRVKPCFKNCQSQEYHLKNGDQEDQITFFSNKISSGKKTYKFKKIFGESASQEEIFETVAKPIIKSVLTGYNGTIFTYGQTGSGKTYTMTGDLEGWINPGLIPRTVQEIFKQKARDTPITITYCEIYNEHVYDLIRIDRLDPDLPQVSLLEDSSGITHFRNLSVHLVRSAFEALQLLVRGDANKMVAETNSNARSSRSHVIFSIGLEFPHPTEDKLCLKPVLYLVDLAGSEKLSKCKTPMNNPLETRYINLSLHYLEQVLIALRQPGRNHIPYRNSLMTALLRNSLGGNCITAMIATFSLSLDDLEETLQTCRFAERIALIKNEVKLSELVDPQKQLVLLRRENEKLKAQLKQTSISQVHQLFDSMIAQAGRPELDDEEREKCAKMVQNFIKGNNILDLPVSDIKRMEFCAQLMREEILKNVNKDPEDKKLEKCDCILDLLKKNSIHIKQNIHLETRVNEESRVKYMGTNGGRKRNPIDLPKVNLTYKRWKSTEEISEDESNALQKLSSNESTIMESKLSNSIQPRRLKDINSDSSLRKNILEVTPPGIKQLDTYVIDNCFLDVTGNRILEEKKEELKSRNKEELKSQNKEEFKSQNKEEFKYQNKEEFKYQKKLEINNKNTTRTISSIYLKAEFPSSVIRLKPLSSESEEKLALGEMKKLISVGIQVDDISDSAEDTSSSSKMDTSSVQSFSEIIFSGMSSLPLTGDKEVDEEIVKFYKARYESLKKKDE